MKTFFKYATVAILSALIALVTFGTLVPPAGVFMIWSLTDLFGIK